MAAVGQPRHRHRPDAKPQTCSVSPVWRGHHLRNAALGNFDHPSRNTSINPVDNSARGRESPAKSGLSWGSDQINGGGDGIRTHGLYIANVALYQLSYTPGAPRIVGLPDAPEGLFCGPGPVLCSAGCGSGYLEVVVVPGARVAGSRRIASGGAASAASRRERRRACSASSSLAYAISPTSPSAASPESPVNTQARCMPGKQPDQPGRDRHATEAAQQHGAAPPRLLAAECRQCHTHVGKAHRLGPVEHPDPLVVRSVAAVDVSRRRVVRRSQEHQLGSGRVDRDDRPASSDDRAPGIAVCSR